MADFKRALSEQGQVIRAGHSDVGSAIAQEQMGLHGATTSISSPSGVPVDAQVASISDAGSLLDDRTALLEYAFGEGVSGSGIAALWVVTSRGASLHELGPMKPLADLITDYRKTLESPLIGKEEIAKHIQLGQDLYRALIGPARHEIDGKDRLIIVPAGTLYYLPFEALIEPEKRRRMETPVVPALRRQEVRSELRSIHISAFVAR